MQKLLVICSMYYLCVIDMLYEHTVMGLDYGSSCIIVTEHGKPQLNLPRDQYPRSINVVADEVEWTTVLLQ